ncbi:glycoside hydrolase domain-containing protein [Kitasatospora sp. LaBMicrA B282]|uniref:glycoside hydrolase domain-containing protein n=1 Tax=Kitasatospora sp. LaBMicrA B282 TaxID=3420949 RepID=UPI003D108A5C
MAHAAAGGGTKTASYLGYHFRVPGDWQVVDLAHAPSHCVRFDQHAVYLGTPSTLQNCPSHLSGRTEALLVGPRADAGTSTVTTDNTPAGELDAIAPRLTVTATYASDRTLVQDILQQAGLARATTAANRSRAAAAAAPVSPNLSASVASSSTDYTGYGFDTCAAPSSSAMGAWLGSSPYRAVGIYIGGGRACAQPALTAGWVQQQAAAGWHFIPTYVGTQAGAITDPTGQGTASADDAVNQAAALGFGPGSTIYDDMEQYGSGYRSAVLGYLSAWTAELHARGYRSGVYSSSSAGIVDLADNDTGYTMPDAIWDADWNGAADTNEPAIPSSLWSNHQRIHQYQGNVTQSYGGVAMNIDTDYLNVALGSGAQLPAIMRVDTLVSGKVYDNQRNADGSWGGAALLDGNGQITQIATAALTDGTFHVDTLVAGKVYDNQRNPDGTWNGAALLDGSGQVTQIAATGLADGTMHVQTLAAGKVYDNQRNTNGTWNGAALLDGNGQITAISAAGLTDGTMHVQTLVAGQLYDNQRNTNGTWNGAALLDSNGQITAISSAGLADGTMHVQTLVTGKVYDNQRNTNGTWNGAALLDGNGQIAAISSAGLTDGTMHVQTLVTGKVYDNQRNTNGTWNGAALLDGNGQITAISAAAFEG